MKVKVRGYDERCVDKIHINFLKRAKCEAYLPRQKYISGNRRSFAPIPVISVEEGSLYIPDE